MNREELVQLRDAIDLTLALPDSLRELLHHGRAARRIIRYLSHELWSLLKDRLGSRGLIAISQIPLAALALTIDWRGVFVCNFMQAQGIGFCLVESRQASGKTVH